MENMNTFSIQYSDKDVELYENYRAIQFLNNSIWGKSKVILKMMDYAIKEYGFVPTNRMELKAFEIWLNAQIKRKQC